MADEIHYIERFNNRDSVAFGYFYEKLYKDLYYYASNLYGNTELYAEDVIHDIFVSLWTAKNIKFENTQKLKAYIIISIKNKFRNYLDHQKSSGRYVKFCADNNKEFINDIAEVEVVSSINNAVSLLPTECAKIFRLHVEEWNVKEIADKLGKAPSTVYAQKQKAITILMGKLRKVDIKMFSLFF